MHQRQFHIQTRPKVFVKDYPGREYNPQTIKFGIQQICYINEKYDNVNIRKSIHELRIAIPPLILSETCPEDFTAETIRKIFHLLPVEEIELDLNHSLYTQSEILTALAHGHYLAHVRIHNCIDPIISLPTTITSIELHTEHETPLIKNIVKMENVKKI